jgi:Domain of unknown function (DUF397)
MTEPGPGAAGAPGWRRSRHSGSTGGHCVEVAPGPGKTIRVRDSKDPAGPVLAFAAGEWAAFLRAVSDGELAPG